MRAGRPRKSGARFPSGDRRLHFAPHAGEAAIYVLELPLKIVKIGYSRNPALRLNTVVGHGPLGERRLICCFWMPTDDATRWEDKIHKRLQRTAAHMHGEFYYLTAAAAIATIKKILRRKKYWIEGIKDDPGIDDGIATIPSPGEYAHRRWLRAF